MIQQFDPEHGWQPAQPLPPSRRIRFERWLARNGLRFIACLAERYDERGLGR